MLIIKFKVQCSMSFRWLDKLSIDVSTYGSSDNNPDWVDAQKPNQEG